MIKFCRVPLRAAVALAAASLVPVAFSSPEPQPTVKPAELDANGQPARLLSAFFGLDNGLGIGANRICPFFCFFLRSRSGFTPRFLFDMVCAIGASSYSYN